MILYANQDFFRIVLAVRASVFYRFDTLLAGFFVAALSAWCSYWLNQDSPTVQALTGNANSTGWSMMGSTIIFAIVFRTNLAWQRYWEAMTQLQLMYSKWQDAFASVAAFIDGAVWTLQQAGDSASNQKANRLKAKLAKIHQNFCLMSALGAHRLTHGDIQRMEKRSSIARSQKRMCGLCNRRRNARTIEWKDLLIDRKDLRIGEDLTGATFLPGFSKIRDRADIDEINIDNTWFGEYNLAEIPTDAETEILQDSTDRVGMVNYWILRDLSSVSKDLDVGPPIQTRMYQEISNGMLGYKNCTKIADVPFPFQLAQLFNMLIVAFAFFIPIYSAVSTESFFLSPLIAFVTFEAIYIINKVAMEMETPFGCSKSDISVRDFHAQFLEGTLELVAGVSEGRCSSKIDELMMKELDNVSRKTCAAVKTPTFDVLLPPMPSIIVRRANLSASDAWNEKNLTDHLAKDDKPELLPANLSSSIEHRLGQVSLGIEQHMALLSKDLSAIAQLTSRYLQQSQPDGTSRGQGRNAPDSGDGKLLLWPREDEKEADALRSQDWQTKHHNMVGDVEEKRHLYVDSVVYKETSVSL